MLGGRRFSYAIEVVGFSDEEGVRFGTPFLGSRALAGTFDAGLLDRPDESGRTMRDAIRGFGLDPNRIPDAKVRGNALGYLEFHIEQGPVLEHKDFPLGIVDVISGQSRLDFTFNGAAAHAGTTPMALRRDALAGAASWIVEVEKEALAVPGLVATVGRITVEPGAGNVVPARASLALDVRHAGDDVRLSAVDRLTREAERIAVERRLAITVEPRLDQQSVPMDRSLSEMLARAVEQAGCPVERVTSGAGHDAMVVAEKMPAAMLFLRCAGGISHHPAEDVREDDVAVALAAGVKFLEELGRKLNSMGDIVVRGGTVVHAERRVKADIRIADGRIAAIEPDLPGAAEEIDARGLHVLPGLVDVHLHFNEPGRTDWEGAETGSHALAAGGGHDCFSTCRSIRLRAR